MARRVVVLTDKIIRQLDVGKNSLTGLTIRQGTVTSERDCTDDITKFGANLVAVATLWLPSHVYAIGDLVHTPNSVSAGKYRCIVAHTSTATPGSTWASDLAAGYWEAIAPIVEGQPTASQTKVAEYEQKVGAETETVNPTTGAKTLSVTAYALKGYSVSHSKPPGDSLVADLDEIFLPDPTPIAEQLVYVYRRVAGGRQERYSTPQTLLVADGTLEYVGTVKE